MAVNCAFYGDSPPGVCHIQPEAKKRTVVVVGYDDDFNEITEDSWLPICRPCNEYWFDGTEEHPRLYPL